MLCNKIHDTDALIMRAVREQYEGVKKHRYTVLKRCRERDIVRPPTPVQITPELPTATVFYSRVARNLVRSLKKSLRSVSHYCGYAVIVTVK